METNSSTSQKFRILVIDDNSAIHNDFNKILNPDSNDELSSLMSNMFGGTSNELPLPVFDVDSASQGQEGLKKIEDALAKNKPYAVVFVDIRMPPGWDGIETIKRIWQVDDKIQTIICTAYSDYSWSETIKKLGQTDRLLILKKPFDNVEIRQLACALSEKWHLNQQLQFQLNNLKTLVDARTATLRATLEATYDGIIVTDKQQNIIDYNDNFINIWHLPANWQHSVTFKEMLNLFESQIVSPKNFKNLTLSFDNQHKTSNYQEIHLCNNKYYEFYVTPLIINSQTEGSVYTFHDITQRKAMEEQLAYQATHDLLTNLPNRALLVDRIEQSIKQAIRNNTIFAVVFIDLDRFKLINDTLGHKAGDMLLQIIAQRLKHHIRDTDTVARLSGDEFVILLNNLQNEEDSIFLINKLLNAVAEPAMIDNFEYSITASIGISLFPQAGNDAERLLKNADTAMYRAKEFGRNNFQFFTEEMNQRASKRLELEQYLQKAVERNEFLLHYQPSIDLMTGNIVSFEALIRWEHPKLGLVPPMQFIPLAEETGAILPIGEWVINTACQQLKTWKDKGFNAQIAINLSGNQLKQKNIVDVIKTAIKQNNINPTKLELELTESSIITNTEFSLKTLKQIKELGVKIAIDDFGTGYSSLSYLSRFPIDKIKIDQSFVSYIGLGTRDIAIILAILTLGNKLNLRVVAEGVETIDQLIFLKENHCQEVQGFYFSKPLSGEACTELLLNNVNLFKLIDIENKKIIY